jgi:quercetin dioxygenase-like cupin family protein
MPHSFESRAYRLTTAARTILGAAAALTILVAARPALATAPTAETDRWVNYALVIDPDATDRVQINLPAATEYEEDVPTVHGTRSPSIFVFVDITMSPNGSSGWHFHPGVVLVTVAAGSVEWYDAKCTKHVRGAGDFFTESDQLHYVRNVSSVPTRMIITVIIAKGLPRRIYAPAPPCAAALGLQ